MEKQIVKWIPWKTLILTVGLPRSGKSTWAAQTGWPIVNRDAIRLALHGQAYIQDAEDMVTAIETYMVKALFGAGNNTVVVDSMNLKDKYLLRWKWIVKDLERCDLRLKLFDTGWVTCMNRAEKDGRRDLLPIIRKNENLVPDTDVLSKAGWWVLSEQHGQTIAIDFDGPLHQYGSGWLDGSIYDPPTRGALEAVKELLDRGYNLVVFTCRKNLPDIQVWLRNHFDDWTPEVTNIKPVAVAYIDNRAISFENWPKAVQTFNQLQEARKY